MVGFMGMWVQSAVLPLLKSGLGVNYMTATILAVEAAVLQNFAWHEKFTWRDRSRRHHSEVTKRLLQLSIVSFSLKAGQRRLVETVRSLVIWSAAF